MCESLSKHCSNYHLYVFAFDEKCHAVLNELNLPNITVISLTEFEDANLLAVKPSRSRVEYFWTCTPATILFCVEKFKLDHCTYLDADLCFYSDPIILFEEMGEKSVLIVEHRYTPGFDYSETCGKYNVQYMVFKNNNAGLEVLRWWYYACLDWCYSRFEDGKLGDQKYLDDWAERFKQVHVLQNEGGGVAPWNVQQYRIVQSNPIIFANRKTKFQFALVFYHFHNLAFYTNNLVQFTTPLLILSGQVQKKIYYPYVRMLLRIADTIRNIDNEINSLGSKEINKYHIPDRYTFKDKLYMYRTALLKFDFKKFSEFKTRMKNNKKDNNNIIEGGKIN
jgi:hypothetical protein